MKYLLLIPLMISFSCARRIGDLVMISTRNVDSKTEYVELSRYTKAKGRTLEESIEKAVRSVSGGEYMKNVIIYSNGKVEGDVWGIAGVLTEKEKKQVKRENLEAKQQIEQKQELNKLKDKFAAGDKVSWKNAAQMGKIYTGEVIGMGEKKAMIKLETGKTVEIKYEILVKIE